MAEEFRVFYGEKVTLSCEEGRMFGNDNGKCPQMVKARVCVEQWEQIKDRNHGIILWGEVGTGKSYLTGCIAHARIYDRLIQMCIPVCITGENFRQAVYWNHG